jgi:DNA end-binding protein Ku
VLKKSRKVALGQVVLHNKERIVAIKPGGKGLVMETLRYDYEVRRAKDYFDDIKKDADLNEEQLELAEELVNRKTASFDPNKFKDLYQQGLKEIITAKLEKRPARLRKGSPPPGNVVNTSMRYVKA